MNRSLALFAIGLLFGSTIGFLVAASNGITLDGHHHDHGEHLNSKHENINHDNMEHNELLSLARFDAPELKIKASPDPLSGWNLNIQTTNFKFAPENASKPHIAGQGHAHIYINGEKIARHYSQWFHIADLAEGENTIRVSLNSNDHRQLAIGTAPIEKSLTIHGR